jgi:hypothetical protein
MDKGFARTLTVAGLGLALAVPTSFGSSAVADPRNGELIPLTCGSTTYQVVTMGNGDYTPAHDANSNLMFVPHAFGVFHGELRDASGALVYSFDDPASTQGSGKQKNDVSCTFVFHEVSDGSDPEVPAGWTFDGSGSVTGQVAGHA